MEICVSCKTCKWRDDYSWVCFCPDSIHRADFTNDDYVCDEWESEYDRCREDVGNNDNDGQGSK